MYFILITFASDDHGLRCVIVAAPVAAHDFVFTSLYSLLAKIIAQKSTADKFAELGCPDVTVWNLLSNV